MRLRMADGTYRWHLNRRVPLRDMTGKVIRWYGVGYDIEDRKRAEDREASSAGACGLGESEPYLYSKSGFDPDLHLGVLPA